MTSMMDLLEEYMGFRRHRYLRLDGSTPIAERRDLVDAWQVCGGGGVRIVRVMGGVFEWRVCVGQRTRGCCVVA